MPMLPSLIRYPLIGFYGYGALVHVANMAGLSGFDWMSAPVKWQVLDLSYLCLDVLVVLGLIWAPVLGVGALLVAAVSQIVLYTILREWVLDVPPEFAPAPDMVRYLTYLVMFHVGTLVSVDAGLLYTATRRGSPA